MAHRQMHCRTISKTPMAAQTTMEVKLDGILATITSGMTVFDTLLGSLADISGNVFQLGTMWGRSLPWKF